MQYAVLVDVYDRLGATASNSEKRDVLAEAFRDAAHEVLRRLVTFVRGRLGPAYDRPDFGVSSNLTLDAVLSVTGSSSESSTGRSRRAPSTTLASRYGSHDSSASATTSGPRMRTHWRASSRCTTRSDHLVGPQ